MRNRILLLASGFPPQVGGIERYLYLRCRDSAEQVVVLAPNVPGASEWDKDAPFPVRRYPSLLRRWFGLRQIEQLFWGLILFPFLNWRYHFSWVECGQSLPWGIVAIFLKILGIPYCIWNFGDDVLRPAKFALTRWVLKLALSQAKCLIAISNYTADLVKSLVIEDDKICILHPSLDHHRLGKVQTDPLQAKRDLNLKEYKIILTVARLVSRKGVDSVIQALSLILEKVPNAFYLVVGEGPMCQTWENLAEQLGVAGRVKFVGRVKDDQLPLCYSACDVFALVSRLDNKGNSVEGFGIVYLEAGAFGKPVVAGKQGGVSDAVEHGKTGILVDPESIEAISGAIVKILTDSKLAKRLGTEGRKRALRKTNWDLVSHRMLSDRVILQGEGAD